MPSVELSAAIQETMERQLTKIRAKPANATPPADKDIACMLHENSAEGAYLRSREGLKRAVLIMSAVDEKGGDWPQVKLFRHADLIVNLSGRDVRYSYNARQQCTVHDVLIPQGSAEAQWGAMQTSFEEAFAMIDAAWQQNRICVIVDADFSMTRASAFFAAWCILRCPAVECGDLIEWVDYRTRRVKMSRDVNTPFGFVGHLRRLAMARRKRKRDDSGAWERMWRDRKFCDFTLRSHCGATFDVHRAALAARLPYFDTLFHSGMHEATERIAEIKAGAAVVDAFVQYVYTGELPVGYDAAALLAVAHQYDAHDLAGDCAEHLAAALRPGTVAATVRALRPYADDEQHPRVRAALRAVRLRCRHEDALSDAAFACIT